MNPKFYPLFTLLCQAIGMFIIGLECLLRFPRPDLLIDTLGCAFAYPIFYIANVPTIAYVHYPFLSDAVRGPSKGKKLFVSLFKHLYYRILVNTYSFCGRLLHMAITNSAWTHERIQSLWKGPVDDNRICIIYPPCDLSRMRALDLTTEREPVIFSLGQFRPEKNQSMQLDILARVLERRPEWKGYIRLAIYGGCRDATDHARADAIMQKAVELDLDESITVVTDVGYEAILEALQESTIGLHTMVDEHFGINIVEFMAAGPIAVANQSGGPLTDIIKSPGQEGFLCTTVEEYAETIERILSMPEATRREVREKARQSVVNRFDASIFEMKFSLILFDYLAVGSKNM